jgi:amino acid adenylation domain-containing protein
LPKSIEAIVADIAVSYSGNIYMNLDIKTPVERIKNIISVIEPIAIITNSQHLKNIISIIPDNVVIINFDKLDNLLYDHIEISKRLNQLIDTDPLCIINTSGSTGTPKGVVLSHKSFFDFTEWAIDTLKINDNEIIGSLSPIVFDIYSHELSMLMSKGSTIVILPDNLSAFPYKILEILKNKEVTYIFWVPTIMVNIANMDLLGKIDLPSLKTIWFAGEVLPTKQYNYWHKYLPKTKFVNLYGPIEITLDCTYYVIDREFKDNEPLPIGFPCRNTSLLILNESNQPCKTGQEGELCVRGTSLAMGYYNNPEKTALAFTQNPLNTKYPEIIYRTGDIVMLNEQGEIIFKGRRDTLVKHLGYRIELGEIEHVIVNTLKLVSNGCVIYNHNAKEIILFYESTTENTPAQFRKIIGETLPKYMIPTKYIYVEKMPMNTNGKIDRLTLSIQING